MKTDPTKLALQYRTANTSKKLAIIAKVAKALGTDRTEAVLYITRFL